MNLPETAGDTVADKSDSAGDPTMRRSRTSTSAAIVSPPIFVLSIIIAALMVFIWHKRTQPDDWASLWIAGLLVERGQQTHLYDHHPEDFSAIYGQAWLSAAQETASPWPHPFVQNPLIAYAVSFLTKAMTFETSVLVLVFVSSACFVYFTASAYFLWFRRTIPTTLAALIVVAIIITPAGHLSLWIGQTTPMILAGVCYGIAAAPRRPIFAGIILGIVALVKITPLALILVMLFAARRRIAAVVAIATTAVIFALTFILVDGEVIHAWLERLTQINNSVLVGNINQSLASIIMLPSVESNLLVTTVTDLSPAAQFVPIIGALIMTVAAIAVAFFNSAYRFEILITAAWGIVTAFSAIVWSHYLVLLVVFACGFAAMSGGRWMRNWPYFGIAAVLLMMNYPVSDPAAAFAFTPGFGHAGTYTLIGALVFLVIVAAVHAAAGQGRARGEKVWPFSYFDLPSLRASNEPVDN